MLAGVTLIATSPELVRSKRHINETADLVVYAIVNGLARLLRTLLLRCLRFDLLNHDGLRAAPFI